MTPGRPKAFDREEALQQAVEVFWQQGYQATSIDDLLTRMGIGRQSLYDTFGDKEALFCEAIHHYHQMTAQRLVGILQVPGSPLQNIRNLFAGLVTRFGDGECRGCLVVNSSIEFAGSDEDSPVMQALRTTFSELEKALRKTLKQAVAAGELPADFETARWATFLTANMQGMLVMAKTGTSRAMLQRVADGALAALQL
jgi:AcrR family transcriptional regulator